MCVVVQVGGKEACIYWYKDNVHLFFCPPFLLLFMGISHSICNITYSSSLLLLPTTCVFFWRPTLPIVCVCVHAHVCVCLRSSVSLSHQRSTFFFWFAQVASSELLVSTPPHPTSEYKNPLDLSVRTRIDHRISWSGLGWASQNMNMARQDSQVDYSILWVQSHDILVKAGQKMAW